MSLFDIFTNGTLTNVLGNIASQAKNTISGLDQKTPGGMGGLLGAGALGALLGNVMNSDILKNVALAGAGAVAWNFFQKWKNQGSAQAAPASPAQHAPVSSDDKVDPLTELVARAMIYAAKADGQIDVQEQERINEILKNMLPGENIGSLIAKLRDEPLDPQKIAAQVSSPEQAEDVLRLSCAVIDIDHFMERGYIDGLARSLNISSQREKEIEAEASEAKKHLKASLNQIGA